MSIKKAIYILLTIGFCSALYSSISNTWKWASDFNGLVILVSISDEERSYNPYSKDFFWVSQDMAVTMIKNMEYLYERCAPASEIMGGCQQPRIEYAGRLIGIVEPEAEQRLFEIIQFLVQRGEPIDAYSTEGYTALQAAILGNNPALVALLLEAGADPYLPINREGELQCKNSIEFVELLSSKNKERFAELSDIFHRQMPNKSSKKDALISCTLQKLQYLDVSE